MSQLSQVLPQESLTAQAIYAAYKKVGDAEQPRGYLGASLIGHECERYLWYVFRFCCKPEFDGRMYRLFETGQKEETRICRNLRDIGCEVHEVDKETNEQFSVNFFGGHFSGHLDGCIKRIPEAPVTWHVLEDKTHNTKSFTKLKKEGVKVSKPRHYAQMQVYMHGTGMERALYFAVCKETDEIYTERVRYEKEEALKLIERAERIITTTEPCDRISTRSDDFRCKFCDAKDICWGCEKALPLPIISCKQCCYASPVIADDLYEPNWHCKKHDKVFGDSDLCADHLCLPGLFPYAEPIDYTDGMIVFKNLDDGKQWEHGGFCHSTKELIQLDRSQL